MANFSTDQKLYFSILQKPMGNREDVTSSSPTKQFTSQNVQFSICTHTTIPDKWGLFILSMYICWSTNPRIRADRSPSPPSTKTTNSKEVICKEVAPNTLRILVVSLCQSLYGKDKLNWRKFLFCFAFFFFLFCFQLPGLRILHLPSLPN